MTAFFFLSFLKPEKVQKCAVTKKLKPVKARKQRSSIPTRVPWNDCMVVPSHTHPHPPLPPCLSEYLCHLSCCANTVVYSFTKLEHDPDCWRPFCHCLYLFISLCFHFSGTTAQTLVPILSPSLTMTQTTGGCSVIACTFSFHCVSISVGLLHKHCGLLLFLPSPNVTWTTAGHSVIFSTFSCRISIAVGLLHQHCGLLLHQTRPSRALRHLLGHQKQWGQ